MCSTPALLIYLTTMKGLQQLFLYIPIYLLRFEEIFFSILHSLASIDFTVFQFCLLKLYLASFVLTEVFSLLPLFSLLQTI